jgi:hypothetical protein
MAVEEVDALAHLETYGLTTRAAFAKAVTDGDSVQARRLIRQLVRERRLFHFFYSPTFHCYRHRPRRLSLREVAARYAILSFSLLAQHPRPLLSPDAVTTLFRPLADTLGVSTPRFQPCYTIEATETRPARVSLIVVGRSPSLQRAVAHLDAVVRSPGFLPWHFLAMTDSFLLTYLLPSNRIARQELTRWLQHRPPISCAADSTVEIPVFVSRASPLPTHATQKRTNPRRGSFSSRDGGKTT